MVKVHVGGNDVPQRCAIDTQVPGDGEYVVDAAAGSRLYQRPLVATLHEVAAGDTWAGVERIDAEDAVVECFKNRGSHGRAW